MKQEKSNNFGLIRLIGAVAVIVGHMYVLIGQSAPMFMWDLMHGFGVACFLSIGGYLITKSWMRQPHFLPYIVKRVFRIFPALIACILLTVYVVGPLVTSFSMKEYFSDPLIKQYLKNSLLLVSYWLPGVFENNVATRSVNGSLWCLPVEFLMYLIIPIYLSIGKILPVKLQKWYYGVCTLLVIATRVAWHIYIHSGADIFVAPSYPVQLMIYFLSTSLQVIPYFFVGSFFAVCKMEKRLNMQIATILICIAAASASLSAPFCYVMGYLCIPYVVLSLALAEKPVFMALNKRDISYGMFLWAYVIQQTLIHIFLQRGYAMKVWILILLSIILSAAMGFLTEIFVERPVGKFVKRLIAKME